MTGPIPDALLPGLRDAAKRGRYITPNQVVRLIDEVLAARRDTVTPSPPPRTADGKFIDVTPYPESETP